MTTCRRVRNRLRTLLEPSRKGHSLWVLLVAVVPLKQRAYLERESKLRGRASLVGGAVVESPPADAGDVGSCPVRGDPTCRGAAGPVSHGR